jgi:hypothetical protein
MCPSCEHAASWPTDVPEAHMEGGMEPGNWVDLTSYQFPGGSTVFESDGQRVLWGWLRAWYYPD